jgi:N-ethylmaleimide reductase
MIMAHNKLFVPQKMGDFIVPNRVFFAPVTRNRAHDDGVPGEGAAIYYAQRASAGLLISEAVDVSLLAKGYIKTPGIWTDAQVEGWKPITDAIHAAGGRVYCQLGHSGRIRNSSIEPAGGQPVAPSAIRAHARTFTHDGYQETSEPRELSIDEIDQIVENYAHAARNAKRAGFDGVEIHAANGYLLNEFLQRNANQRCDDYGGSIENRSRLVLRVVDTLIEEIGAGKLAIRLSPNGEVNDATELEPDEIYGHLVTELDKRALSYLHLIESFEGLNSDPAKKTTIEAVRQRWHGFYVANGAYTAERADQAVAEGWCHAVSLGRLFIANPDLPMRWQQDADLNDPDQTTFYGGGREGYTDYPSLPLIPAAIAVSG